MATSDKLQKLLETKAAIRQAIIDKGVEVPDETVFADYPEKISAIEGSNNSDGEEELTGSYVIARFENCEEGDNFIRKAKELDMSHFDTSNIENMHYMFNGYEGLETLDLSGFDTSNVDNMESMFNCCENLKTLDLSGFDTNKVINMEQMFIGCENLITLDLSSFDTSNVETMRYMFERCEKLITLDLSNFNTSNVNNMECMFANCENLASLDLSNFDTSNVESMSSMFERCEKLVTLKLNNCSYDTIARIINDANLPTGLFIIMKRKMYVNPNNIGDLTPPDGWKFIDAETGEEIVPGAPVCEFCGEEGCDGSCQDNGEEPETPEGQEEPYIVATFGTDESVDMLGEPSGYWKASFDNGTTWKNNDDNMTEGNEIVYLKPKGTNDIKIYRLFEGSSYVTHIEFHNFSAYPVYPYADFMFFNCSNLTELDLSSLNFSNGMNNLACMFYNCNNLESLNLSSWSLYDDTGTSNMFEGCNSLHTLRLDNCNEGTINKIITSSNFPTGTIEGVTKTIYCKEENAADLTAPTNWVFSYVD